MQRDLLSDRSLRHSTATARWLARVGLVCVVTLASLPVADAQNSILHEFIPPDPNEDISLAATMEGGLPTFLNTPSGIATAPDPLRPSTSQEQVYNDVSTSSSPDATYEPDRDTRRPHIENYDDPFSPATAPFKRLRAYDGVRPDYSLFVEDRNTVKLRPSGQLGPGDEPFYGDIAVDLVPSQPVRIPTVGPGARLLRMHVNPEEEVSILRDGADNWFVQGNSRARVRVVVELAIQRDTFGSQLADVDWSAFEKYVRPQYAGHQAAFEQVAQKIGISRAMRPREVVHQMVEYFRAFAPSDQPPNDHGDIYLDLALSQKGVCRHRSFAFLVTALHIGIPTRMVVNEAHAWVEVFDATLWHRIDLGGAALNMEQDIDQNRPPYVPPPDPYAWPDRRDSGQDLADRSRAEQQSQSQSPGSGSGNSSPSGNSPLGLNTAPTISSNRPVDAPVGHTDVAVTSKDKDVFRSRPFHLQGHVTSEAGPCSHVRIDVILKNEAFAQGVVIGSLSTDERGHFDGAVVIPRDFTLGDYELVVATPGDSHCSPGSTR